MAKLISVTLVILILIPQYYSDLANFAAEASLIFLSSYFPITAKYGALILKEMKGEKPKSKLESDILDRISHIRSNQEIISSTLAELKDSIEKLPNLVIFYNNLDKINREMTMIHQHREDMWKIYGAFAEKKAENSNYKLDEIARSKIRYASTSSINGYQIILSHLLNPKDSILHKLIELLSYDYKFLCGKKKSLRMFIIEMFEELKIVLGERTAVSLLAHEMLEDAKDELDLENQQAQWYTDELTNKFNAALKVAPRSIWTCNPDPNSESKSYVTLNDDVRLIPAPRLQEPRVWGAFSWNITGELEDYCESGPLDRKRKGPESGKRNDAIKEEARNRSFDYKCNDGFLNMCVKGTIGIELCYKYDTHWFNRPENCPKSISPFKFNSDEYCMCECYKENHLVNLDPVFSDTDNGMIVTGAKLAERRFNSSHFEIYIEIQEGKLMGNGRVNASTVQWRENPINNEANHLKLKTLTTEIYLFAQDFYDFEPDKKDNNISKVVVLTGLQFASIPNEGIHLKIHGTPISFDPLTIHSDKVDLDYFVSEKRQNDTGKFHRFISKFDKTNPHFNDPVYEKFSFSDYYLDVRDKDRSDDGQGFNKIDSDNYQSFTLFRPSSLEKDRGQNAVPYIELQKIETNPPTALTGAALYHKGQNGYGGYIALELRSI